MIEGEELGVQKPDEHDGAILAELLDEMFVNPVGRIFFRQDAGAFVLHSNLCRHVSHEAGEHSDDNKNSDSATQNHPHN